MTLGKLLTLDQSFVKRKNGWTHEKKKKLGRKIISRGEYWNNFFSQDGEPMQSCMHAANIELESVNVNTSSPENVI